MKKFLALLLIACAAASGASAQTRAPAPSTAPPPGVTPTPAPASPLDGTWRGTSDGGSCNAPLDYLLTIESGFVDGSAYDTTGARAGAQSQQVAAAAARPRACGRSTAWPRWARRSIS